MRMRWLRILIWNAALENIGGKQLRQELIVMCTVVRWMKCKIWMNKKLLFWFMFLWCYGFTNDVWLKSNSDKITCFLFFFFCTLRVSFERTRTATSRIEYRAVHPDIHLLISCCPNCQIPELPYTISRMIHCENQLHQQKGNDKIYHNVLLHVFLI